MVMAYSTCIIKFFSSLVTSQFFFVKFAKKNKNMGYYMFTSGPYLQERIFLAERKTSKNCISTLIYDIP